MIGRIVTSSLIYLLDFFLEYRVPLDRFVRPLRAEALSTLRDGRKPFDLRIVVLVEVPSTVILGGLEIVILVAPRCAT
jgi:hypothetical protein